MRRARAAADLCVLHEQCPRLVTCPKWRHSSAHCAALRSQQSKCCNFQNCCRQRRLSLAKKKEAPTPFRGNVGAEVYVRGRMGDDASTAWQCQTHLHLTAFRYFAMCWLGTKGLLQRQQSRRPLGDANGFAFVPYHFKSNRRSRSSPSSPCQDAQSDPKSISP